MAESTSIDVENLSENRLEQADMNDTVACTGSTTERRAGQHCIEQEKNRKVQLMGQVYRQFFVAGAKFHFKDQPRKLAFKDKGKRIVSTSNDDRVAKAMVIMAEAKGWKTVKVSGHPDFQREVWMEACLRGIEARGYTPLEQDLKLLEEKRIRIMRNKTAHDKTASEQKLQHQDTEFKKNSRHQNRLITADKTEGNDFS